MPKATTYDEGISGFVAVKQSHSGQVCPTFCLDSDLNGVIFVQHAVVFTIKPVRDKCVIVQLKAENVQLVKLHTLSSY